MIGYELLGAAIVGSAILLVAGVRAWRQVSARGEKAQDGQQRMMIEQTTDLDEEIEEFNAWKWNGQNPGNHEKHESAGLTEQKRPFLG